MRLGELALGFGLATILLPSTAAAFCRTTTCDPNLSCLQDEKLCCIPDANGCDTNGKPLAWPTSCVSYNVQELGSEKLDISASTLDAILSDSFDEWLSSKCNGDSVDFSVDARGFAECDATEYNQGDKDRNANIWMFHDDGDLSDEAGDMTTTSEFDASALAVTTVSFHEVTGQIYDVDVELNSATTPFTTSDTTVEVDLASVVTHEAGHFLGLDHSMSNEATMIAWYAPGTTGSRKLSEDDQAGICAIYPPGTEFPSGNTCEPRGKYSPKCEGAGCDCRMAPRSRGAAPSSAALLGAGLVLAFGLARRRRSV